jgi:hypothetical protein
MMTRRYRFVEDSLTIGKPETEHVVELTRHNFKLWNRVEEVTTQPPKDGRYADVIAQADKVMFPGLCDLLQNSATSHCPHCACADPGSSNAIQQFGGVRLCEKCKEEWRSYMRAFPVRFAAAFPEINSKD